MPEENRGVDAGGIRRVQGSLDDDALSCAQVAHASRTGVHDRHGSPRAHPADAIGRSALGNMPFSWGGDLR